MTWRAMSACVCLRLCFIPKANRHKPVKENDQEEHINRGGEVRRSLPAEGEVVDDVVIGAQVPRGHAHEVGLVAGSLSIQIHSNNSNNSNKS